MIFTFNFLFPYELGVAIAYMGHPLPPSLNLGVKIFRDCSRKLLGLSQKKVIITLMYDCEPIETFITKGEKLCQEMCHKTQYEIEKIAHVPYGSAVGSLMYCVLKRTYVICSWFSQHIPY
jgi:hypothetical protein